MSKVLEVRSVTVTEPVCKSISVGDKKYNLFDEFDEADGGVIIKIMDNDMIKHEYQEEDWNTEGAFFTLSEDEPVDIDDVACKLILRDSQGGYDYMLDCFGNELYEA